MGMYLLDTDISSYIIREYNPELEKKLDECRKTGTICISSVSYGELKFGELKKTSSKLSAKISGFMKLVQILDFDASAGEEYARIRHYLEVHGTPVGNMDMMIAACAKSNDAVLVSNNEKHFAPIPNLVLENWTE
jgi:tRNA(fMet)-specific endonuclease VapC